jgi:predicted RNase H-like nuclease
VGIDMPIGLPPEGRRECDLLAKRALGSAHSRVFHAPPRPVLTATTYAEGAAVHRVHAGGLGMSVQTWNIVPRIVEVDEAADDPRVVEVHPELSFAAIAGTVLPSKHTAPGRAARVQAVRRLWPRLGEIPRGDDTLDALAVAWSALRWRDGSATVLPAGATTYDDRGRPMRIVT